MGAGLVGCTARIARQLPPVPNHLPQVEREQVIGGVSFIYSPPPRAAVPYAAALRTVQERWVGEGE